MPNSNDELAELCMDFAWRDEIDDDTRWILEQAGSRINRLGERCIKLSHRLEELEARRETECQYHWLNAMAFWSLCVLASLYMKLHDAWSAAAQQFETLRENLGLERRQSRKTSDCYWKHLHPKRK